MVYNFSNLTGNTTNLLGVTQYANWSADGLIGILILISLCVIVTMSLLSKGYEIRRCFAAASFITMLTAFLLKMIELVPDIAVMISMLAVAGSVVMLVLEK